jgi:hypothetical protein
MIKVNAAMNAQFLKRECGSATSSYPSVAPVCSFIARRAVGRKSPSLRERADVHRPGRGEHDSSGRHVGVMAAAEHGESVHPVATASADRDQVVNLHALG